MSRGWADCAVFLRLIDVLNSLPVLSVWCVGVLLQLGDALDLSWSTLVEVAHSGMSQGGPTGPCGAPRPSPGACLDCGAVTEGPA